MKKPTTLGIVLLAALTMTACRTANGMTDRRDDDASPFSVLVAGEACSHDTSPECRHIKYDAMYKYARANGVGIICSWRVARAFRDDKPFPDSCGGDDAEEPKPSMDCTDSRPKIDSGSHSYDACVPIVAKKP